MRHQDRKRRASQHPPGKATENPFTEPAVPVAAHDQEASSSFYSSQQRIGRVLVVGTDLFHLSAKTMTTKVPHHRLTADSFRAFFHADHDYFCCKGEKRQSAGGGQASVSVRIRLR